MSRRMVACDTPRACAASVTVSCPSPGSRSSSAFHRWYLDTSPTPCCAIVRMLPPYAHVGCAKVPPPTASAAAGGSGYARAGLGIVDDPGHRAAQDGAEVDHVPHAAPGDQGGDAERAFGAVLPVDHPGAGHVPVADRVVAD